MRTREEIERAIEVMRVVRQKAIGKGDGLIVASSFAAMSALEWALKLEGNGFGQMLADIEQERSAEVN